MPDGTPIDRYTLCSEKLSCEILTYGGILRSLHVPNRYGNPVDVVLGFDSLDIVEVVMNLEEEFDLELEAKEEQIRGFLEAGKKLRRSREKTETMQCFM